MFTKAHDGTRGRSLKQTQAASFTFLYPEQDFGPTKVCHFLDFSEKMHRQRISDKNLEDKVKLDNRGCADELSDKGQTSGDKMEGDGKREKKREGDEQ